jgi:ubiquinone/menaquinone biosynthesis C-methylase UbiE
MSATPFDELAADYDTAFTRTALGSTLRELVWDRFDVLFHSGQRVLELGCGTGEDAVWLAHAGLHVVATDPSQRMLEIARTKALAQGCEDRIEFQCARMEDVPHLMQGETFSGIVSNFGALNCVHDVPALASGLAELCEPEAHVLLVVMGRHVPWEWAWYGARGEGRKAVRRLWRKGTEWRGLTISYPTPRKLSAQLAPHFQVTRIAPLGCVLPPSYASGWLHRSPRTFEVLQQLERIARHSSTLAWIADHFIVEARHTPSLGVGD